MDKKTMFFFLALIYKLDPEMCASHSDTITRANEPNESNEPKSLASEDPPHPEQVPNDSVTRDPVVTEDGRAVIVITEDRMYRKRKRAVISTGNEFVKCADVLLETLKDMHKREEAFLFRNRGETMTCMLRSTSEATDELMTFDLVLIHDPAKDIHDAFKKVMDMEYTVIPDDEGDYVIDTLTVSKDATPEDMSEALESINLMYEMDICECYRNLVKSPDLGLCYMCAIMRDPDHQPVNACIICADLIQTSRGGVCMNCCGQYMHKKCYERWRSEEEKRVCPICRK